MVIPIGKTSLSINKTRIRRESNRKIYPYRKHWRKCDCQGKCDIYWPCSKLKNWKSNFDLILTFRSLTRDLQRNTISIFRQKSVKVDHEESHCRSVNWWLSVKNWNTSGMAVLPGNWRPSNHNPRVSNAFVLNLNRSSGFLNNLSEYIGNTIDSGCTFYVKLKQFKVQHLLWWEYLTNQALRTSNWGKIHIFFIFYKPQ